MDNPFYTHQKYLRDELAKLNLEQKSICLEFGTGDGSGCIINEFLEKNDNLSVYSFESNYEWFTSMAKKYKAKNYHFNFVYNWNDYLRRKSFEDIYDVVFVDQTPWEARIKTIDRLKHKTKTFILHDYDFFNKGIIEDIYSVSKGSFFHNTFGDFFIMENYHDILPPTLILRNKNFLN